MTTIPVEPELAKEAAYQRRSEFAVKVTLKYLEGVALVYDIDERWVAQEVIRRLQEKIRD